MTAASMIDGQIESMILASADGEWRHVALLIARTTDACRAASVETTAQAIAARIYALVARGELVAQGNVRRWRAGKIRAVGIAGEAAGGQAGAEPAAVGDGE